MLINIENHKKKIILHKKNSKINLRGKYKYSKEFVRKHLEKLCYKFIAPIEGHILTVEQKIKVMIEKCNHKSNQNNEHLANTKTMNAGIKKKLVINGLKNLFILRKYVKKFMYGVQ